MRKPPKRMLLELPTAEEIDTLAISTPDFTVRKFEFSEDKTKANLDRAPCKGQMVLVIRGPMGTALVQRKGEKRMALPSGTIHTYEEAVAAAKRVAKHECGLMLSSVELAAMYDVVWHHEDVSVKRLHLVYSALTEDSECRPDPKSHVERAGFFTEVPQLELMSETDRAALEDCSGE